MTETIIRITLEQYGETWVYRYPPRLWKKAIGRAVRDEKRGNIPTGSAERIAAVVVRVACNNA
jgi:hypothetical protein